MSLLESDTTNNPFQSTIEMTMRSFEGEERWDLIVLFSSEGLKMASAGKSPLYQDDNLLEFMFSLIETAQLLDTDIPVQEIIIRGKNKKWLVFRYFDAMEEQLVLGAVLSGKKGYRRAMKKLIRQVKALE